MRRSDIVTGLLLMWPWAAFGQPIASPGFEVASVKPTPPTITWVDFRILPGGRLEITNLTVKEIVQEAFGIKHYQLAPEPAWIERDRFDITAKAEGSASRAEMMRMLQDLLRDRFQLKVHREAREGNVFRLHTAKNGPTLKVSAAETSFLRTVRNTPPQLPGVSYTWPAQKVSMKMLAERLGEHLRAPVIDDTQLAGEFDFQLDFATNDDPETGPSIFVALQRQLGLKLEAAKGPVETLIIDRVEKPSGN